MKVSKFEDLPKYPHAILKAFNAVIFLPVFHVFTRSTKPVLCEIIERVDLDAVSAPILFKRADVAEAKSLSLKTVHNVLNDLEKAGYIVRYPRPKSSHGCDRISITKTLAELLGLPWPEGSEAEKHE